MSLRSASPCTSTSSPSFSCTSTAWRISLCMASVYSATESLPALNDWRARRMAEVCGKEPMVVVGNAGSCRRARCCSIRCPNGDWRWLSAAVIAARRACTAGLWIRDDCARLACTARLSANAAWTLAFCGSFSAVVSTATSSHFCTAKASQLLSSASSLSSRPRSTGLCSSEQLGATHRRSPIRVWACCRMARAFSRSVRQTLRPLTTPRDSTL